MKIQSISDIITNSSSEVFLFRSDLGYDFLKNLIEEHYYSHLLDIHDPDYKDKFFTYEYNGFSGMAGEHELIKVTEELCDKWDIKEEISNSEGDLYLLDIDHDSVATKEWIKTTFKNVERID